MIKNQRLVTLLLVFGLLTVTNGLVQANVDPPELPPPYLVTATMTGGWDDTTGTLTVIITANIPMLIGDDSIIVDIKDEDGDVIVPPTAILIGASHIFEIVPEDGENPHIDVGLASPNAPPEND